MNVLYLYNATQTYTSTVFEHISSFNRHSSHRFFFAHQDQHKDLAIDLSNFDAVIVHYTIRLAFNQMSAHNAAALSRFKGLKAVFIQDEYDFPHQTGDWIRRLGIQLVFTVVPEQGISSVYPSQDFPGVRFVSVLTGYVPEDLVPGPDLPPSKRNLIVGYRGRPLPIRYGELGREKITIAQLVADFCVKQQIPHDIKWSEESRIYGSKWYEFVQSCRSMLGTESGSNVFDWDGSLTEKIQAFKKQYRKASNDDVYASLIQPLEMPGLMNQISPRVFEAIASRTVLLLFEGEYSKVIFPGVHFIPLKKDGSNLDEAFRLLADGDFVDVMADKAYEDIIASGRYSYAAFVGRVDEELERALASIKLDSESAGSSRFFDDIFLLPTAITTRPIQAPPPREGVETLVSTVRGAHGVVDFLGRFSAYLWWKLPESRRGLIRPKLKRLLGRG